MDGDTETQGNSSCLQPQQDKPAESNLAMNLCSPHQQTPCPPPHTKVSLDPFPHPAWVYGRVLAMQSRGLQSWMEDRAVRAEVEGIFIFN